MCFRHTAGYIIYIPCGILLGLYDVLRVRMQCGVLHYSRQGVFMHPSSVCSSDSRSLGGHGAQDGWCVFIIKHVYYCAINKINKLPHRKKNIIAPYSSLWLMKGAP